MFPKDFLRISEDLKLSRIGRESNEAGRVIPTYWCGEEFQILTPDGRTDPEVFKTVLVDHTLEGHSERTLKWGVLRNPGRSSKTSYSTPHPKALYERSNHV